METLSTQPMLRLLSYLKKYKKDLGLSSSSAIINKIFDLMPPFLTAWMIDTVSKNPPLWIESIFGISDMKGAIIFIGILTVIAFSLESFFEWLFQRGFMRLAQKVQHDLRVQTYDQLQHREIAFFEKERTGNLMSIINDDINQLERFLNGNFAEILHLITLFIFCTISLFLVNPKLALIGMAPIPFIFLGSIYYQRLIRPYYQKIRNAVGILSSRLENNISGIMVVKSFTAEKYEKKRVEKSSAEYRDANFSAIRYNSLFVPIIRTFITIGFVSGLVIGAFMIMNDTGEITIGILAFFAMMVQRLLWPVTRMGRIFDEFERANASAKRVFGVMDHPSKIIDKKDGINHQNIRGNIAFNHVSFQYDEDHPILKNINLKITEGVTTGVVGVTGTGKTTLIKLLLRLYDVQKGSITIDDYPIQDYRLEHLRKNISLVSQDVYLFHGTILENIAYNLEDVSKEKIIEAAKKAELHDFIISLKNGYQSIVGERGIKLSGGQRQRLSIARAILKNSKILILDEATSSVDTETEKAIQKNLNQLSEGKTTIIIAHRLSTIKKADNIIVLNNGQIHEQGTHQDLVEQQGVYADLWKVQIGEY